MAQGFQIPSILTRVSSMVDGGLSVGFHTKELSPEEKAQVLTYHNRSGWLVFAENEVPDTELPKGDADLKQKTPSQRLRAVIYVLYQQSHSSVPFAQFYEDFMDGLIIQTKEALV